MGQRVAGEASSFPAIFLCGTHSTVPKYCCRILVLRGSKGGNLEDQFDLSDVSGMNPWALGAVVFLVLALVWLVA